MTRERRGMIPRASYMVNITEFLFFSARENRVNKKKKKVAILGIAKKNRSVLS